MPLTSIQEFRITLRNFLLSQSTITDVVVDRIYYTNWYSIHANTQVFPLITISQDTGHSYIGLASNFNIIISGHSNLYYDESGGILQLVSDILDPTISWLGHTFSVRGSSNPTDVYNTKSRVYTTNKSFVVNIVGV